MGCWCSCSNLLMRPEPRNHRAIHGRMPGNDDDFGCLGFLKLTHQLDTLTVRQAKVGQQDVGPLPPELDTRIPQAVRSRYGEALHARNFLQPVHDVSIVVDYQSMCHVFPWDQPTRVSHCRAALIAAAPLPLGTADTARPQKRFNPYSGASMGWKNRRVTLGVLALGWAARTLGQQRRPPMRLSRPDLNLS